MRPRKTPSRLEVHRLRYNANGRRGPLLTIHELDEYEKDLIQQELLKDVRVARLTFTDPMDEEVFDHAYLKVLTEWGVMCNHPYYSVEPIKNSAGYKCRVCDCAILWPTAKRRAARGE
jgi:hypothetical protein